MGHRKKTVRRSQPGVNYLTWSEHMFIGPEDKRLIRAWASQYGWSPTVAKRNFTVYRALEWLAAVLEDQLEHTEGWFWCQQERIALRTGMSRPTVKAAIEALTDVEFVEHERRWLAQSESVCSWFRLKIPPSCAGRVPKDRTGSLRLGMAPPAVGMEKNSTRQCKKFGAPSYMSKREITSREKARALAEIQDKCLRNGLDPFYWSSQVNEIVETAARGEAAARRKRHQIRSAGICDPLDVKKAA